MINGDNSEDDQGVHFTLLYRAVFSEAVDWFLNYFTSSTLYSFKSVGDRSTLVSTQEDGMAYCASGR